MVNCNTPLLILSVFPFSSFVIIHSNSSGRASPLGHNVMPRTFICLFLIAFFHSSTPHILPCYSICLKTGNLKSHLLSRNSFLHISNTHELNSESRKQNARTCNNYLAFRMFCACTLGNSPCFRISFSFCMGNHPYSKIYLLFSDSPFSSSIYCIRKPALQAICHKWGIPLSGSTAFQLSHAASTCRRSASQYR